MGIFGNKPSDWPEGHENAEGEYVGMWIGPRPEPQSGLVGWAAMGQVVPFDRRSEGYRHLKQMGFTDREKMFRMVEMLSDRIQRDDVHGGMEDLYKMGLDVTGIYRLVAVMLHDPEVPKPAEPTYVDLVEENSNG